MTSIQATYRITTPLFLGSGQAGAVEAGIRGSSFKGALVNAWRMGAWGRLHEAGSQESLVTRMRDEERALFGSAELGQARFLLDVEWCDEGDRRHVAAGRLLGVDGGPSQDEHRIVGVGARYFGYGLMQTFRSRERQPATLDRACFRPDQAFRVTLRWPRRAPAARQLSSESVQQLVTALRVVGSVLGIGSRSRKGYGSLSLESLTVGSEEQSIPSNALELADQIEGFWKQMSSNLPRPLWTAFGQRCRTAVVGPRPGPGAELPLVLLDQLGQEQVRLRSWGHGGEILGSAPSEFNFRGDHDLMKAMASDVTYPERIAFGLPYGPANVTFEPAKAPRKQATSWSRRASPLFIHLHRFPGGKVAAAVTLVPSVFLDSGPDSPGQSVTGKKSYGEERIDASEAFWWPLHAYMDRLIGEPVAEIEDRPMPFASDPISRRGQLAATPARNAPKRKSIQP